MYAEGKGVAQDYVRAYMWLDIAVAQGNSLMTKHLKRIAKQLTAAQIAQAQQLAREWLARN